MTSQIPEDIFTADVLDWLLAGDPAIRWQVLRDLVHGPDAEILATRARVATEGWGATLLSHQGDDGRWGKGLYGPKWISTTYTLLLLMRLGLPRDNVGAQAGCRLLLDRGHYQDGGINFFASLKHSETCVTGMVLSLLSYFQIEDSRLEILVDWLLHQQMADDGWNCRSFLGAHHSSFHTTISVLEGLRFFELYRPYRAADIQKARIGAINFLLAHQLYRSDRTGNIVDSRMTRFSFPPRWRYDVMRALDFLREVEWPAHDSRLDDALSLLLKKRGADGKWPLQNRHSGRTYFEMEKVGSASRWNTLRALRILQWRTQ